MEINFFQLRNYQLGVQLLLVVTIFVLLDVSFVTRLWAMGTEAAGCIFWSLVQMTASDLSLLVGCLGLTAL